MSRPLAKLRPVHGLVAVLVLAILGWLAYRYVQRRGQSPFVLWNLRAGMPLAKAQKEVLRYGRHPFSCHAAIEPTRLCTLRVTGIPGLVRLLVDGRDRAAVVQFLPDTASPRMREEARRIAAWWGLVRDGVPSETERERQSTTTRWVSANHRWAALMRYGRLGASPVALELRDEPAVKAILSSAPLAPLILALSEVIAPGEVANFKELSARLAPALLNVVASTSDGTPAPASLGAAPSVCEPAPDLIEPNADRVDDETAEESTLTRVLERAYPGSRLVFGHGTWLIDPAGRTERLVMRESGLHATAPIRVYGTSFPTRYRLAEERMRGGRPELFCSAHGDVLFARKADDGSLIDVKRVAVDSEALATDISMLALIPGAATGDMPHMRVRYTAAYSGERWTGAIEWEVTIAGDAPRAVRRIPIRFEQQARGSEEVRSGMLLVMGRLQGAIELATVEQYGRGYGTRTIRVPIDSSGVLYGTRLLERLY